MDLRCLKIIYSLRGLCQQHVGTFYREICKRLHIHILLVFILAVIHRKASQR